MSLAPGTRFGSAPASPLRRRPAIEGTTRAMHMNHAYSDV